MNNFCNGVIIVRVGSVGVDLIADEVTAISIDANINLTDFDAVIINPKKFFIEFVNVVLEDQISYNEKDNLSFISRKNGLYLRGLLSKIEEQINSLCRNGGIVVVLADQVDFLVYSDLDKNSKQLFDTFGVSDPTLQLVTSFDPVLTSPLAKSLVEDGFISQRIGHEVISVATQSVWNSYLNSSLEWKITFTSLPSFEPLAKIGVRGRPGDELVAAEKAMGLGHIVLLPFPRDKESLEILLQCIANKLDGPAIPEWVSNFKMQDVIEKEKTISELEIKIEQIKNEIQGLNRFQKLLYETGDELENVVFAGLKLLGFKVDKPSVKSDADLIIEFSNGVKGICEITGTEQTIQKRKATQLSGWVHEHRTHDICKGILIINPYRFEDPSERYNRAATDLVSPHAIKECESNEHVLIDSLTLFEIIQDFLQGSSKDVYALEQHILETTGILSY